MSGAVMPPGSARERSVEADAPDAAEAGDAMVDEQSFSGGGVRTLLRTVLQSETAAVELLLSLEAQASALNLIWEAYERGAVTLPETIVRSVTRARREIPPFLREVRSGVSASPSGLARAEGEDERRYD